jgi:hypothetical protein
MSLPTVLAPVFVQVALTFALLFWMGRVRVRALTQGKLKLADIALGEPNWPPQVMQISNSFHSQFQLPVLFYLLVGLAMLTRTADWPFVAMAWLFVVSRFVHAFIHTGTNYVRHRFNAFAIGMFILLAMWLVFAVRILFGVP